MSNINLYDDQLLFVEDIRDQLRQGRKSVLAVASTGFGKTVLSAYLAEQAVKKGKKVWFLVHLKNLLNQTTKSFWNLKIQHGLIASGKPMRPDAVQIATVGTLANRLDKMSADQLPDLLIVDETHLCMSPSFLNVIDRCKENGATVIGNTATPERLDGKGLGYVYESMVEATPMVELIEDGRLSDYELYSVPNGIDYSALRTSKGDFKADDSEQAMDKPFITGDAIAHWKKYADGLRSVCYCVSIKHSKHTAAQFTAAGIPAAHVDGTTPQGELRAIINDLADGKIKVICNVALLTTGFDLAAQVDRDVTLDCCILLRPTKSVALAMQMIGRVLRRKPYPAIILDHAGVCFGPFGHGLPDDQREWSLEGRKKGKQRKNSEEADIVAPQCDKCFFVMRKREEYCPKCGAKIEIKYRKIEEKEGELEKVERDQARIAAIKKRKQQEGMSKSIYDLVKLGVERGIKKPVPWACFKFASRQKRKANDGDFRAGYEALASIQGGS